MNCVKCYREIPEDSVFCPYCGEKQTEVQAQQTYGADRDSDTESQSNPYQYGGGTQNDGSPYGSYQSDGSPCGGYQSDGSPYGGYQSDGSPYGSYQNHGYSCQGTGVSVNWVPYLIMSIVSMLCCCIPFGIVGIVYAARINSASYTGNEEEALRAARNAKIWIIVSVVTGLVVDLFLLIMGVMGSIGEYYYYY